MGLLDVVFLPITLPYSLLKSLDAKRKAAKIPDTIHFEAVIKRRFDCNNYLDAAVGKAVIKMHAEHGNFWGIVTSPGPFCGRDISLSFTERHDSKIKAFVPQNGEVRSQLSILYPASNSAKKLLHTKKIAAALFGGNTIKLSCTVSKGHLPEFWMWDVDRLNYEKIDTSNRNVPLR